MSGQRFASGEAAAGFLGARLRACPDIQIRLLGFGRKDNPLRFDPERDGGLAPDNRRQRRERGAPHGVSPDFRIRSTQASPALLSSLESGGDSGTSDARK